MNNIYFTADLHCGPYNRRTMRDRGFCCDWQKHQDFVTETINANLHKSDILYIAGDLGWKDDYEGLKSFMQSLKCVKKVAVGNHDNKKHLLQLKAEGILQDVKDAYCFIKYGTQFHITHYPLREWYGFFDNGIHLHGHTHGNLSSYLKSMDVGIDAIGYKPISMNEVIDLLKDKYNVDEYRQRL